MRVGSHIMRAAASYDAAEAGSLVKLMGLAIQIQETLERGRIPEATQACKELFAEGRHHVARVVLEDRHANPILVAFKLVEALDHPGIPFGGELKGEIAQAARLFMELTLFKCLSEGGKPKAKTTLMIREKLQRIQFELFQVNNQHKVNDQVQLDFNVTCCLEALKSMELIDYSPFIKDMVTVIKEQSIGTNISRIKMLKSQLGKSWFADLLYISWMGSLCTEDVDAFNVVVADISRLSKKDPKIALDSIELYADLVHRGSPAIQSKALDGLLELANLRGGHFDRSYWKVRYRGVQHLYTLFLHSSPAIKDRAAAALLLINARESQKNILGLFEQIEKNPQIIEQWKLQFAQENFAFWEEKDREEEQELNQRTEALEVQKLALQKRHLSLPNEGELQRVRLERESVDQDRADFEAKTRNLEHLKAIIGQPIIDPASTAAADKNLATKVKSIKKDAEQGHIESQYALATYYEDGLGVDENQKLAVYWYRKAAEQGYAAAQYSLGLCYHIGEGVVKDDASAVKWYRKAAEQGHAVAQCNLGAYYAFCKDFITAVKWYRIAAEQGYAEAQYKLGTCYRNGIGVVNNEATAVDWYRKAAEQGHSFAQFCLGACYHNGRGVVKDEATAVNWYRQAAEQGHSFAQFCLGACYHNGRGVVKDEATAVKWYQKAADQGHATAQDKLAGFKDGQEIVEDYQTWELWGWGW